MTLSRPLLQPTGSSGITSTSEAFSLCAAESQSFPEFDTVGWNEMLSMKMSTPCFAWAMRDKSFGNTISGKGRDTVIQAVSALSDIRHECRITEAPLHLSLLQDEEMASYAEHKFETIVNRDKMVAIDVSENDSLIVPEGTRPLLLSVYRQKSRAPDGSRQYGYHWFSADKPIESGPDETINWSHWDGEGSPMRYACGDAITNPWAQCRQAKYEPVSYFLVPTN